MAIITGTSGNDTLYGGINNDTLTGGAGDDQLYGGSGNDTFDITGNDFGIDHFYGGDGTDVIRLRGDIRASNVLWNSSYLDSVETLDFNFRSLGGTSGNDVIDITGITSTMRARVIGLFDGNDIFRGFDGADLVDGGSGQDTLYGNGGNDTLIGGAGDDVLYGGSGSDVFEINSNDFGIDYLYGGDGTDTVWLRTDIRATRVLWNKSYLDSVETLDFNSRSLGGTSGDDIIDISGFTTTMRARLIGLFDGHDIFRGFDGADQADGGSGNDTLYGNGGNDTLIGGAGDDVLYGGSGNDVFEVAASDFGTDRIYGGDGTDIVRLRANIQTSSLLWNDSHLDSVEQLDMNLRTLSGTSGKDHIDISAFASVTGYRPIALHDGNDLFIGHRGNDTVDAGSGRDTLIGGGGKDHLNGGDGIDTIDYRGATGALKVDLGLSTAQEIGGGQGRDTLISLENILGSRFSDVLTGNASANRLEGNKGHDTLSGLSGNDHLLGGDGNDHLIGGTGNDTLNGGAGIDTAVYNTATGAVKVDLQLSTAQTIGGGAGRDTLISIENLIGSRYNDVLTGHSGANRLEGGAGNDTLRGNGGNDHLLGGAGKDRLIGGSGNDTLNGGSGVDTADYTAAQSAITVDLRLSSAQQIGGGEGRDKLISIENLIGSRYNDKLTGDGAANRLEGGAGHDNLSGMGGHDVLIGGAGRDTLRGGEGRDTLTGGEGADTFVFKTAKEAGKGSNRDVITDFTSGLDRIRLSDIDADTTRSGSQDFTWSGDTAAAHSLWTTTSGQNLLLRGDTNGDGQFDFEIQLNGLAQLSLNDLLL